MCKISISSTCIVRIIHTCRQARCGYIGYCLFVILCVCTVTDLSAEDNDSGVTFCTAVHRRPRQGIAHFGELCSPRSPKSDESASARVVFYINGSC